MRLLKTRGSKPKGKKKRNKRALESDLVEAVHEFLLEQGCDRIVNELGFFNRGIDVYGIKRAPTLQSYAVELKIYGWRRALQQAVICQLCSHFAYVAMPLKSAQNLERELFDKTGVGLLGVDLKQKKVSVLIPALLSKIQKSHYLESYSSTFRD